MSSLQKIYSEARKACTATAKDFVVTDEQIAGFFKRAIRDVRNAMRAEPALYQGILLACAIHDRFVILLKESDVRRVPVEPRPCSRDQIAA